MCCSTPCMPQCTQCSKVKSIQERHKGIACRKDATVQASRQLSIKLSRFQNNSSVKNAGWGVAENMHQHVLHRHGLVELMLHMWRPSTAQHSAACLSTAQLSTVHHSNSNRLRCQSNAGERWTFKHLMVCAACMQNTVQNSMQRVTMSMRHVTQVTLSRRTHCDAGLLPVRHAESVTDVNIAQRSQLLSKCRLACCLSAVEAQVF